MVRSATQFPMVLPWFNHDFFFFFFLQVRFLTSLFFFFFFCEISHPKISPWETLHIWHQSSKKKKTYKSLQWPRFTASACVAGWLPSRFFFCFLEIFSQFPYKAPPTNAMGHLPGNHPIPCFSQKPHISHPIPSPSSPPFLKDNTFIFRFFKNEKALFLGGRKASF